MSIADESYTKAMELADRRREAQTTYPDPPGAQRNTRFCKCEPNWGERLEDGSWWCSKCSRGIR